MANINEFFCGLHYLVGLADQAEACCKIWDSLCWGSQKVGSLANAKHKAGGGNVKVSVINYDF